jgi:heme exporter protein D
MIWQSFSEFLGMHGYGLYVWGSFGITFLFLAAEVLQLRSKKQQIQLGSEE